MKKSKNTRVVLSTKKRNTIKNDIMEGVISNPLNLQAIFRQIAKNRKVNVRTVSSMYYKEVRHGGDTLFVTLTSTGACTNAKVSPTTKETKKAIAYKYAPLLLSDFTRDEKIAFMDMILK